MNLSKSDKCRIMAMKRKADRNLANNIPQTELSESQLEVLRRALLAAHIAGHKLPLEVEAAARRLELL